LPRTKGQSFAQTIRNLDGFETAAPVDLNQRLFASFAGETFSVSAEPLWTAIDESSRSLLKFFAGEEYVPTKGTKGLMVPVSRFFRVISRI